LAILAGLIASLVMGEAFTTMLLGAESGTVAEATAGVRWLTLLGIVAALAVYALLRALAQIIATVSTGDPFTADNAGRLRVIGWSLLTIQLLDIVANCFEFVFPSLGSAAPDPDISLAGWLAVLLTFVLARVFVVGARMRDDLEGTV
jgi:hypothetical protein